MIKDHLPADVMAVATETYQLERDIHDLDKEALENAIIAALRKYEDIILAHVAEIAENFAVDDRVKADDVDGSITLRWFAEKIRSKITNLILTKDYMPVDGDRVEVILTGEVMNEEDECSNCGHVDSNGVWSVTTDTGNEHFFDLKETHSSLRVRILSREDD